MRPAGMWRRRCAASLILLSVTASARAVCSDEPPAAQRSAERIEAEWPLRPWGDPVNLYLRDLSARLLARVVPNSDLPSVWQFTALRDLSINAFSIGDGRAYITDGALLSAAHEGEIAAILAHEIGHQLAGHFCRPVEATSDRRALGSLHQVIDLNREIEADRWALMLLKAAGFSPHALQHVIVRLAQSDPLGRRLHEQRLQALALGTTTPPYNVPDSAAFQQVQASLRGRF